VPLRKLGTIQNTIVFFDFVIKRTLPRYLSGLSYIVLFSIRFEFTAINCPRSLQILHCQRMLSCTLQKIYSSVAIPSSSLIKKSLQFWRGLSCNMQTSNFRLCKRICCDCKTLIAQFKKNSEDCCNFGF
jgi:hypothetical protein